MSAERQDAMTEALPSDRRTISRTVLVLLSMACLLGVGNSAMNAILIGRNASTIRQIQQSREDSVRTSCEEQNARHDSTVAKLDDLIAALKDPVQAARARASKPGTVVLIDRLAPHRDCEALVRRLTK